MNSLIVPIYELREKMRQIYAKYTLLVKLLIKFAAVFCMIFAINVKTGYMQEVSSLSVTIVIALICSFMPWGGVTVVLCGLLLIQFLKLSIVVAVVALAIILVMMLVNFIFAPGHLYIAFLVPAAFVFKVPFLLPVVLGLTAPLTAIIPMIFGIIFYFFMDYVSQIPGILSDATEVAGMSTRFIQLIDGIKNNKLFLIMILAFAVTVVLVYTIRRLSIDHAWVVAVTAGIVVDMAIVLLAVALYRTDSMTVSSVILNSIACGIIAYIIQFMIFAVDYKQSERTQFEDDEYYYYVKAVPKVHVASSEYDKIKILEEDSKKENKKSESKATIEPVDKIKLETESKTGAELESE